MENSWDQEGSWSSGKASVEVIYTLEGGEGGPADIWGEEQLRQREEAVQRPWGRNTGQSHISKRAVWPKGVLRGRHGR